MPDTYSIDANVIVTLNRDQPRDVYPSVWEALEDLVKAGRAQMCREVLEELKRVDDACAPWVQALPNFVVEATEDELDLVQQIADTYEGWVQDQANAADPFVVAHAYVNNFVVVTLERRKGPGTEARNLKIPNVCDDYGVACMNFTELARAEGWIF